MGLVPHVPKVKKVPDWVTDIFGIKGKDDVVPRVRDPEKPTVDITETTKLFTKADDTKPSWTNFDWMKPKKYTKAEGIDVLQTMYPHVDFTNIKLGDKPTQTRVIRKTQYIKPRYQSRSGELEFGGGYHHLPPSNFMEVLEKFRLGEITHQDVSKKLGMGSEKMKVWHPTKTRKGAEGVYWAPSKGFEKLVKAFMEKYPSPEQIGTPKYHKQQTQLKMPQREAWDLAKIAQEGDKNIPFELRFYKAFRDRHKMDPTEEMGSKYLSQWEVNKRLGEEITGVPLSIHQGRYDKSTGLYRPRYQKEGTGKSLFEEAKDGDILTYKSRTYARNLDLGNQKNVQERITKKDPEARWMYNFLKEKDPSGKYYDVDHVQATIFNGSSSPDNLRATLKGAHSGSPLEVKMTPTGVEEIVSMKSAFDRKVYLRYQDIIDTFNRKDIDLKGKEKVAQSLKKEIQMMVDNFKKSNPNTDFIIGDPWVYVKNSKAERGFDKMRYMDKVLPKSLHKIVNKYIVKHQNLPNKGDDLNSSLKKVWERLIPIIEMSGGKFDEATLREAKRWGEFEEGGLVKPHMAYGGDMAQFTEMESVVPDLNPAEAGMEDYVQMASLKLPKFKNPFKPKPKPNIISDISETSLKITDKTKAGTKVEGTVKMEGQTPIFHLKSDLELTNAAQDRMTPQQWWGYLTKRGVSQTELHEFGLGNILKNLGGWEQVEKIKKGKKVLDKDGNVVMIDKWKNNAPITKAELISQYKLNKPIISYKIQQIEPFEKGWKDYTNFLTGQRSGGRYLGDMPDSVREFEEMRQLRNKPQDLLGDRLRSSIVKFISEVSQRTGRDLKSAWPELEPQITANINKLIKDAYGIENVVENGFGNVKVPFYTQNLVNRFSRLKKGEGFYMGKAGVGHEGAQFLEGGTGYIEIPFTYNPNPKGMRANEPRFTFGEGHFTNKTGNNPVFWLRASERVDESGKRTFLIEEIQSDMHQKPKQKPDTFKYAQRHDAPEFIKTTYSLSQLKKLKAELTKVADQIDKVTGHTDPSAVTVMERLKVKREALRNQIREAEDLISEAAGKSDEVFPEGPWKKSENQAKIAIKTLINLATQEGFDNVAIISGKAKNYAVSADSTVAKGNRAFYDNIAVSGMRNVAKNLGLEFSHTNIKDGKGNTWAKIPIIKLKKEPVKASVDMYKADGGFIYRPSFVDVVPTL
jgi:hypothetical protein